MSFPYATPERPPSHATMAGAVCAGKDSFHFLLKSLQNGLNWVHEDRPSARLPSCSGVPISPARAATPQGDLRPAFAAGAGGGGAGDAGGADFGAAEIRGRDLRTALSLPAAADDGGDHGPAAHQPRLGQPGTAPVAFLQGRPPHLRSRSPARTLRGGGPVSQAHRLISR